MIPIIGLRVHCNRTNTKWSFNSETVYLYALITILNIPLTRLLVNVIESIISSTIYVETTKYTVVAFLSSVLLPLVIEAVKKFIQIDITISLRKKEKTDEK